VHLRGVSSDRVTAASFIASCRSVDGYPRLVRRVPYHAIWAVALAVGLIAACGRNGERSLDPERIAYGSDLYQEHCASCHGEDLSGHPDWRTPDEDGFFRPPPQDSSGHTWHRPDRVLIGKWS
jgi:Cytochrome c